MREDNGAVIGFECRINHRYSFESMVAEQTRDVEAAVWTAVNCLEERAALLRKHAARSRETGIDQAAARFDEQAEEAEHHAETIHRTLLALVQSLSDGRN